DRLDDGAAVRLRLAEGERADGAIREPEAARIVLHQGVPARQPLEPAPLAGLLPLELEVTGWEGRHPDDDSSTALSRIGDPHAVAGGDVFNTSSHGRRIAGMLCTY